MEREEKNSRLFYLIIALIVLGFIASLAFPVNAQHHKPSDTSRFAGHFVPAIGSSAPATEFPRTDSHRTSFNSQNAAESAPQISLRANGIVAMQRALTQKQS